MHVVRMKWQSIHSFTGPERLLGVPLFSLTIRLHCRVVPSRTKAFFYKCVHLFFLWQWERQDTRDGSQGMLSKHELHLKLTDATVFFVVLGYTRMNQSDLT